MKQQINEIKRMQQLAGVPLNENEVSSFLGGKVVYASSTLDGMFEELVILDKTNVINDSEETEDGTYVCKYNENGEELEFFYIDKAE